MRQWWRDYRCLNEKPLLRANISLFGLNAGFCATPFYDAFKALEMTLINKGYSGVKSAWVPRNCPLGIGDLTCQPDGSGCSIHNYGVAIDIDPFGYGNPHFQKPFGSGWDFDDCKLTREQVLAVESIENTNEEVMFRWLGWPIGDTMHFETQVPPSRVTVNWGTVPGYQGDDVPRLPIKVGDEGEDVRELQVNLNKGFDAGLTTDGVYGPSTVAAVLKFTGHKTNNPNGRKGEWVGALQDSYIDDVRTVRLINKTPTAVDPEARAAAAVAQTTAEAAQARADRAFSGQKQANDSLNKIRSE